MERHRRDGNVVFGLPRSVQTLILLLTVVALSALLVLALVQWLGR